MRQHDLDSNSNRGRALSRSFSETDLGDSDKLLDLDALGFARSVRMLEVTSIRLEYSASSEVGTRELHVQVRNGTGDVLFDVRLDAFDVVASGSANVSMGPGAAHYSGSLEDRERLPVMFLRPGWQDWLLEEQLDPIGQRLEQPERTSPLRSDPVLHIGKYFALGPYEQEGGDHHDAESNQHFDHHDEDIDPVVHE